MKFKKNMKKETEKYDEREWLKIWPKEKTEVAIQ